MTSAFDTLDDAAASYDALRAELATLKANMLAIEQRLEAKIAEEAAVRTAAMDALRAEWANISVAISANSLAVARGFEQLQGDMAEVKVEQAFVREQQRLIGRGMDLLLTEAGLSKVVNPDD